MCSFYFRVLLWVMAVFMAGVFYVNGVVTGPLWLFRRLRPGAAASQTRAVSNAGLEFHAIIPIDMFILVYPGAYVFLMFVLKGPFTTVFSRHFAARPRDGSDRRVHLEGHR